MSTRPQFSPAPVFTAVTGQSMAGNLTSLSTIIQKLSLISYSFSWAGSSPVGVINIQVSNDYSLNPNGSVNNAGTWNTMPVDLNGTTVTDIPVSGNTGNGFADIRLNGGYALRVIYTFTSGTGTLNAVINAKVT